MAGKGCRLRPLVVPKEVFDNNFESIFGKHKERKQVVLDVPPPPKEEKAKPVFGKLSSQDNEDH